MSTLLSPTDLAAVFAELEEWRGDSKTISRHVTAPSFLAGIRLVDDVAAAAEEMDHHPDIDIRWRTVTFTLSTHSDGGVTDLDVTLARRIDKLTDRLTSAG